MNWEQIKTTIDSFTDKPLVIAITTILVSAAFAFILFSKTSLGKKAIRKLTDLYALGKEKADKTLEKVQEVEILATEKIEALKAEYEEKAENLKSEYEQKAAVLISLLNFYEETLFVILEKIPNAKVQNELAIFKANYQGKKAAITETIGEIYEDFNSAVEKNKEEVEQQYKEKIDYLADEIKKLNLYISELKGGEQDGEQREESENTDSIEEEI